MKVTIKLLKDFGVALAPEAREELQRYLDGGGTIERDGCRVFSTVTSDLKTPGEAVKFAAALNKCRRPLHLIKQDLDKDWAERVKARDNNTCALCGVMGDKMKAGGTKDVLTAHHWLKTKARAGLARWSRACGVTVHFAEHIHTLHENPCWADLDVIYRHVAAAEGVGEIERTMRLAATSATEKTVRALWRERMRIGGAV